MNKEMMLQELDANRDRMGRVEITTKEYSELAGRQYQLASWIKTIDALPTCEDELIGIYSILEEEKRLKEWKKRYEYSIFKKLGYHKGTKFSLDGNLYMVLDDNYLFKKLNKDGTPSKLENAIKLTLFEVEYAKIV